MQCYKNDKLSILNEIWSSSTIRSRHGRSAILLDCERQIYSKTQELRKPRTQTLLKTTHNKALFSRWKHGETMLCLLAIPRRIGCGLTFSLSFNEGLLLNKRLGLSPTPLHLSRQPGRSWSRIWFSGLGTGGFETVVVLFQLGNHSRFSESFSLLAVFQRFLT